MWGGDSSIPAGINENNGFGDFPSSTLKSRQLSVLSCCLLNYWSQIRLLLKAKFFSTINSVPWHKAFPPNILQSWYDWNAIKVDVYKSQTIHQSNSAFIWPKFMKKSWTIYLIDGILMHNISLKLTLHVAEYGENSPAKQCWNSKIPQKIESGRFNNIEFNSPERLVSLKALWDNISV